MTKTGRQRGIPEFPPNLPPLLLPIEQEKQETFHLIAPVVRRGQQSYPVQAWYSDKTDRGKERLESWSNSEQGKGKTIQQQQCSTRTKVEQQQQQSEKKVQTSQ